MEILKYEQFLFESSNYLEKAELLYNSKELDNLLNETEEGVNSSVQIVPTEGISSYIGVALNDGFPVVGVFKTFNPKIALLAIILKNVKNATIEDIKREITQKSSLLMYSVYGGHIKPTKKEVADRFNIRYADFGTNNASALVNATIAKRDMGY